MVNVLGSAVKVGCWAWGRWAKRGVGVLPTSNAVAATAAPAAGVTAVRGTPGGGESGGATVIDGGQSGVPERLPLSGTLVQGGEAWGCLGGEVSTSSSTPREWKALSTRFSFSCSC